MKNRIKTVFILDNGKYVEISYQELERRRKGENGYGERKFIPLHGVLLEVTESVYKYFYKVERRRRYVEECAIANGAFSYEDYSTETFNGEDMLVDKSINAQERLEKKEDSGRIQNAFARLSPAERQLIGLHYEQELSEAEIAQQYGVSQQAISKRLKKVKEKLKVFLQEQEIWL